MTTIGNITSQANTNSATDRSSLIQNYETFLNILTTQLQHQDPMEPMDSTQFTEQLVQFSSVEQQIRSNQQLEDLTSMFTNSNALGVLNFVGTTVTIDGSNAYLSDFGSVSYGFNSPETATAEITIRNVNGDIVANYTDVAVSAGAQSFRWDGTDGSGNRLGKGAYSIQINAADDDGNAVSVTTDTSGVVESVDLSSSEPMLIIDGRAIPTSQVRSVGVTASG